MKNYRALQILLELIDTEEPFDNKNPEHIEAYHTTFRILKREVKKDKENQNGSL